MNLKKTALATALAASAGAPAVSSAAVVTATYEGLFTIINYVGVLNNPDALASPGPGTSPFYYGNRTPIAGSIIYDTVTGSGSGSIAAFSFLGSGLVVTTNISFQGIGNGKTGVSAGPGPYILGNLGFNWNTINGIPISVVLDGSGFFAAISAAGGASGLTNSQAITGGVTGATEGMIFGGKVMYTLPMGPGPIMTTTFDTTDIGAITLGTNPSGTLPLSNDGTGGSPMKAGPWVGFNANFDFLTLHVNSVPVPAAAWLFGSGLIGLIAVARRKK